MTACPSETELARAISIDDAAIAAHVATCPACMLAWTATTRAIDLARQVPVAIPSRDQREEMRTAILAASSLSETSSRGPSDRSSDRASDRSSDRSPDRSSRLDRRWYLAGAALAAAAALVLILATRGAPTHAHGTITAHANARYTTSPAPDEVVTLHDGAIEVDVSPLHAHERFRVVTADTEIEVRGTAFEVVAELGHVTSVQVRHGRVEVRPHTGTMVTLGAGQSWTAPTRTAGRGTNAGSEANAGIETNTDDGQVRAMPSSTPTASTREPPRAKTARTRSTTGNAASESTTPRSSSIVATTAAPASATRAPEALAYDEGWSAMRGGDFEHAASAFARVSILDPEGPLSEDASYWYPVALARAKRAEAIATFRDFLARYPYSAHAGEANAMLGWLLVDAKQLAEAERRFRVAVGDANPAVRDSASRGLAALRR